MNLTKNGPTSLLNRGWTLEKINLSFKVIFIAVTLIGMIFAIGASWARQEYKSFINDQKIIANNLLIKHNSERVSNIELIQQTTQVELTRLNSTLTNLEKTMDKIEQKLE